MRQFQSTALHRVCANDRRLVLTIPADLVRELQVVRREYALITRSPGRALRVEFPAKPFGDRGALRDLAARAAPGAWKKVAAGRPKPRPLVRRKVQT